MLKRLALSVALAVIGAAIVAPASAQADVFWLEYANRSSGQCIDVKDSSSANGAMIQEYPCKVPVGSGAENQEWLVEASGSHGQLVNEHSGKCLELVNGSLVDGGIVWQWACTGATKQQWDMVYVSTNPRGTENWLFKSAVSGKCLHHAPTGTSLYQVTCNSADSQQVWRDNLGNGCAGCAPVGMLAKD